MRGERDWHELGEFIADLRGGSRFRAAKLREPQLIERMALQADPAKPPAPELEEFDPLRAELANIQDILWRILYAAGRADPKHAPSAPRPELPWAARRSEIHDIKSRAVLSIWMPWEVNN